MVSAVGSASSSSFNSERLGEASNSSTRSSSPPTSSSSSTCSIEPPAGCRLATGTARPLARTGVTSIVAGRGPKVTRAAGVAGISAEGPAKPGRNDAPAAEAAKAYAAAVAEATTCAAGVEAFTAGRPGRRSLGISASSGDCAWLETPEMPTCCTGALLLRGAGGGTDCGLGGSPSDGVGGLRRLSVSSGPAEGKPRQLSSTVGAEDGGATWPRLLGSGMRPLPPVGTWAGCCGGGATTAGGVGCAGCPGCQGPAECGVHPAARESTDVGTAAGSA